MSTYGDGFTQDEEAFRQEMRQFLKGVPPQNFPLQMIDDGHGTGGWSYEYTRERGKKRLAQPI